MSRWFALWGVISLALIAPEVVSPDEAVAAKSGKTVKKSGKKCKGKKCRRGRFAGHGVRDEGLRTESLSRPSGWVHISHPGVREQVRVNIYNVDGSFNEAALAELDGVFRCRRTKEVRAVDPRLYEILSMVYDHFGQREILLASGF